jgi:hypothetical protein
MDTNKTFIWDLFFKLFDTAVGTIIIMACYFSYYLTLEIQECIQAKEFLTGENFVMSLISLGVLIGSIVTAVKKTVDKNA